MAIHSARGATKRPAPNISQVVKLPAPTKGIDGRIGLGQNSPEHCIYTYNLLCGEYGMKIRKGWREYANTITSGSGTGVKTIIPYTGALASASDDKLFAVTNEGIWDVSTDGDTSPTKMLTFATTTDGAGEGVYTSYVTDADAHLIFYADPLNGLFTYDDAAGTWAQTAGITGITAANVNFVVVHKLRIWLIESGSSNAWYLDVGAIAGEATKFQFGSQFKHGGSLAGLYNWTLDGGAGVDDWLVAVSDSGDVIPYSGGDPSISSWTIQGVYYIGAIIGGNQCATETGGDLYLLSTYGLTNLSELINGVKSYESDSNSLGSKMSYMLRADIINYRYAKGWSVRFLPCDGVLVVTTPVTTDGVYKQYAYELATNSFGLWRDIPMLSNTSWSDNIFVGTLDNRILIMDDELDNVAIVPPLGVLNGEEIQFSTLLTFNDLGASGVFKRLNLVRPDFISTFAVTFDTRFNLDYQLGASPINFATTSDAQEVWDTGVWDTAVWASSVPNNVGKIGGASGYGRTAAVAIKGVGRSSTWFISVDVMWTPAGVL